MVTVLTVLRERKRETYFATMQMIATQPQRMLFIRRQMGKGCMLLLRGQLLIYRSVPYPHPYELQRSGENGPLLLQDHHLIDLLSHFDRERIPERVVHAKGAGAHGTYTTTDSLEDLCLANIFQQGKTCSVTARFSTVGGESGSHDCARDPRGFSVKFRTEEGNWDVVANNTPVFFLRDAAKFP